MKKNKLVNYITKKKKDGSITLWSLSALVFVLGGTGITLNTISTNENINQTQIESPTLDLENNSIHSKVLSSARLVEIEDKKTSEITLHLCNIEFQNSDNQDNVFYKDVFSKDLVCIIKADCDSIEVNNQIKTDIGLYTDISEKPIIYGVLYNEKEIKSDLEKIKEQRIKKKEDNKEFTKVN